MNRQISPVTAAIVIVVVIAALAFAGYKLFLEPEKPRWSPGANYGAPGYNHPATAPSTNP